jgi:anhydro-N-acetylmuramic acid kinase
MKAIGLISGTSVDGIDAVLVEIQGKDTDLQVEMLTGETFPYPTSLREEILAVCEGKALTMAEIAKLDDAIAIEFAHAAQQIQKNQSAAELIGSHGQTVFHRPPNQQQKIGYSLQLGRGALIANLTQTITISNFRQADIAAGGHGAPLVPAVDAYLFGDLHKTRVIQNLGGIGNLTYIPAQTEVNWNEKVCGWDTGPGNALLDMAVQWFTEGQQTFDHHGQWAAQGTPDQDLVNQWLTHDFFKQTPPKSTGRELFSETYLQQCWEQAQQKKITQTNFLATLTELTVASLVLNYSSFLPQMPDQILLCGGGSRNLYLKKRLASQLNPNSEVLTTDEVGISADFKEAIAFAVLAYWRYNKSNTGNLPLVTGAKQPVFLGEINFPLA